MSLRIACSLGFVGLLTLGCGLLGGEASEDGTSDEGLAGSEGAGSSGDGMLDSADETGEPSGESESGDVPGDQAWVAGNGPCGGSKTNALWFDDRDQGYVGCGENAEGEGLYTTVDGGITWDQQQRFGEVRVMDIRRGPDGVLYGAGIHQLDRYPVWAIDEGSSRLDARGLYDPSSNAFTTVRQAENVAVTSDGQILIDSLTGTTAAYQASPSDDFVETSSLSEVGIDDPDAVGFQVRRVVTHNNRFYAVGSLINDPARIHLPSQLDGATYHFISVELQPSTRDGELLDMHIWDDDHIIVVGHDQSEQYPLIYLLDGGDPYDVDSWEKIELFDSGIDWQGGINDIAVEGDTVVAVGERVPTAEGGFVVVSRDGGRTWEEMTPPDAGPLSRVWRFDGGDMVVAGGGGELWRWE